MIFKQLNPGHCRTYLVGSERTREVVLVDPLLDGADRYVQLLQAEGLKLRWIIDTHTHSDHRSGAAHLQARLKVHYLMHLNSQVRCVSKRLRERDALGLGELTMTFLHTPGHTQDSLTILLPDRVLTGDFLLLGKAGAGRLDLPGGSSLTHYQALRKLDRLPEEALVFPGHEDGTKEHSTVGEERRSNPVFESRTRDEYLAYWDRLAGPADPSAREILEANTAGAPGPATPAAAGGRGASACALASMRAPALTPVQVRDRTARASSLLFILDVRELEEYAGELGHIPGSVLIPLGELESRLPEVPRDKTVVAVCRSGGRSSRAAELLRARGFHDAYTLSGGMQAWGDEALPVER